jgi:hypothetical protein
MALKRMAIATITGYVVKEVNEDQTVEQILASLEGGKQEGDVVWTEANAPANMDEPLDDDDNMILILRGLPTDLGKVEDVDDVDEAEKDEAEDETPGDTAADGDPDTRTEVDPGGSGGGAEDGAQG